MGASVRGLLDVVKVMVAKGADASARDKENRSPADYAKLNGQQEVVKYFATLALPAGRN